MITKSIVSRISKPIVSGVAGNWWGNLGVDFGNNFLAMQFQNNKYVKNNQQKSLAGTGFTSIHPDDINSFDKSGILDTFGADVPARNNSGLLGAPASATNLNRYSGNDPSWTGGGTTPPIVDTDVTFDGIRGVSATFDENSDSGYGGSRATGSNFPVSAGIEYTASYVLKLSRVLTGSERLQVYITGSYGGWSKVFNSSSDYTTPTEISISDTVPVSGDIYFTIFVHTAPLSSPVTVSIGHRQFEAGAFATSPIITSGAAKLRTGARDAISGLALDTGIDFACVVDIQDTGSGSIRLFEFNDGTDNNKIMIYHNSGNVWLQVKSGGSITADVNLGAWVIGLQAFVFSVGADYLKASIVGQAAVTDSAVTLPVTTTANFLGAGRVNTENVNGAMLEQYHRAGDTVNDTSFAEFETLAQARLTANGG